MAALHHWGATAHPIFKIRISRNTKCDNLVGFPKSGHILSMMGTPPIIIVTSAVHSYSYIAMRSNNNNNNNLRSILFFLKYSQFSDILAVFCLLKHACHVATYMHIFWFEAQEEISSHPM